MVADDTERVICCDADESCACEITEAARTEVLCHVNEGHAVCAHHATEDTCSSLQVQPFPCQRTGDDQ